jgi:hypothetical protein
MTTTETVILEGKADTAALERSAARLSSGFKQAAKQTAILGAGVVALGTAWFKMNQHLADSINDINDMSARTGVASRTLAGLKLAAEGAGLKFKDLNRILNPLVIKIGQADQGSKAAATAFKDLGVDIHDAEGNIRSTDAVLHDVVDSLGSMDDSSEAARNSMLLLGASGGKLMQALGGGELDAFVLKAQLFGTDLGPKASQSAAEWQRATADLKLVFGLFSQEVGKLFGANGAGDAMINGIGTVLGLSVGLSTATEEMRRIIQTTISAVALEWLELGKVIFSVVTGDFDAASEAFNRMQAAARISTEAMGDLGGVYTKAAEAGREVRDTFLELSGATSGVGGAFEGAAEDVEEYTAAVKEAKEETLDMGVIMAQFIEEEDARNAEALAGHLERAEIRKAGEIAAGEAADARTLATLQSAAQATQQVAGAFGAFVESAFFDSDNLTRKQFEKLKRFQKGMAVISAFTASAMALANPPGPPFTIPFAVAAFAQGMATVASIEGQQFHQGRGGTPASSGAMAPDEQLARVRTNEVQTRQQAAQMGGGGPITVQFKVKHRVLQSVTDDNLKRGTGRTATRARRGSRVGHGRRRGR